MYTDYVYVAVYVYIYIIMYQWFFFRLFFYHIDQQFQLCTQDEGLDSCRPCGDGLVTPEQINTSNWSYFYDICHVPECECAPGCYFLFFFYEKKML